MHDYTIVFRDRLGKESNVVQRGERAANEFVDRLLNKPDTFSPAIKVYWGGMLWRDTMRHDDKPIGHGSYLQAVLWLPNKKGNIAGLYKWNYVRETEKHMQPALPMEWALKQKNVYRVLSFLSYAGMWQGSLVPFKEQEAFARERLLPVTPEILRIWGSS